jgi:hypothetical protein
MHLIEIGRAIGRAETTALSAHARLDEVRADLRVVAMGMMRHRDGKRAETPWLHIIGIGVTAISSLLGLILPERAASILSTLAHALLH